MAKRVSKTKVLINGVDVSHDVFRCTLPRYPDSVDTVELVLAIDRLEVSGDGALVIHISLPEE